MAEKLSRSFKETIDSFTPDQSGPGNNDEKYSSFSKTVKFPNYSPTTDCSLTSSPEGQLHRLRKLWNHYWRQGRAEAW